MQDQQAPNFRESCRRFVHESLCHVVGWIIGAGAIVAWYVIVQGFNLSTKLETTTQLSASTASAVDAHIAAERASTREVLQTLEAIKLDLVVLKFRTGTNGSTQPATNGTARPEPE